MRMLRTPPFFPPESGEKPYLEVFARFGLWRDFLNDNIQATISDWLKTGQLIPNQWNFTSATLNHIRFVFLLQYQRERKKSLPRFVDNRPRSIYQYSSMAPRLSGQNCKFFKFLLSLNSQRRLGYKENNTKYRSLTWKPPRHVRILIYRTWPIENTDSDLKVHALHYANELLVRVRLSFQKLLQNRSTYRKNMKNMFGKMVMTRR